MVNRRGVQGPSAQRGNPGHWAGYLAAAAAYLLALLAKEMAFPLPLILVLVQLLFFPGSGGKSWWRPYGLLVGVAAFYSYLRFGLFVNPQEPLYAPVPIPLGQRLLTTISILPLYLRLLVFPTWLNADYVFPPVERLWHPQALLGGALLLGLVGWGLWGGRRHRLPTLAVAWFGIGLLPVANLYPLANPAAERYLYLAAIPYCLALAWCGERFGRPRLTPKRSLGLPVFLAGMVLLLYTLATASRNRDWRDGVTLWSRTARSSPLSFRAHTNLGAAWFSRGDLRQAEAALKQALQLNPDYLPARNNLGLLYDRQGEPDKAIAQYQEILSRHPQLLEAHLNLGAIYLRQGRLQLAATEFEAARQLNPDHPAVHANLGNLWSKQGWLDQALAAYQQALRLDPDDPQIHHNLGITHLEQGRYDEAVSQFRETLRLKPDWAQAHLSLGNAYQRQERLQEAIASYQQALALDPNVDAAHNNLGGIYGQQGRFAEAAAEFKKSLRLNPRSAVAHYNLGIIYLRHRPDQEQAQAHLNAALNLLQQGPTEPGRPTQSRGTPEADQIRRLLKEAQRLPEGQSR